MAENITIQQAAATLADHFGPRLEAGREEGLDQMADALVEHHHLSHGEAKKMVAALEQAHTIRWIERRAAEGREDLGPAAIAPGLTSRDTSRIIAALPGGGVWHLAAE